VHRTVALCGSRPTAARNGNFSPTSGRISGSGAPPDNRRRRSALIEGKISDPCGVHFAGLRTEL
jgi:hypothetical protein